MLTKSYQGRRSDAMILLHSLCLSVIVRNRGWFFHIEVKCVQQVLSGNHLQMMCSRCVGQGIMYSRYVVIFKDLNSLISSQTETT